MITSPGPGYERCSILRLILVSPAQTNVSLSSDHQRPQSHLSIFRINNEPKHIYQDLLVVIKKGGNVSVSWTNPIFTSMTIAKMMCSKKVVVHRSRFSHETSHQLNMNEQIEVPLESENLNCEMGILK